MTPAPGQPMGAATSPSSSPRSARDVVLVTDKLEKPSLDDCSYRVVRLGNHLEVLLAHDVEADKASAAMDVNVGDFWDEEDMPGMAHAVEHLLFLGTKTFPGENDYNQYLSAHSGTCNAFTGSTSTNYYFEVSGKPANEQPASAENPSPLLGALKRFSKFFIEPLFLESSVDRELRAVDSEHKKNLQHDTWRLNQLQKSLSNPKHPWSKFSTGTLEVLKVLPEARGINVRDKFIEFYDSHYSANRMKLVILGREPLDVLQAWAVDLFSDVPNKNLPPGRWEAEVPFPTDRLAYQTFVKPVMDSRELTLTFPIMDETSLFETQPTRYISHLIGHEGPGSILAHAKNKGWATSLVAGEYTICPGTPSLFTAAIRLTEEGLKNYKDVVSIFFQYISLLRENTPQEWIFDEQKNMADVDFKFKQKVLASKFASMTSSTMQRPLPREWLLSGSSRLHAFAPDLIKSCIDMMTPDNLRITVASRNFPGNWDRKEKWYGSEYRTEPIPEEFLADLRLAMSMTVEHRLRELHLPHRNSFIPTKLEVDKKGATTTAGRPATGEPRLIRNDWLARTWWKKDDTFWVPRANVIVSLKNPAVTVTAESMAKSRLFVKLVEDALGEYSYDADVAGLQYLVGVDQHGLVVSLSGYNDKLAVLLEKVMVTMRDLDIRQDRFDIIKERQQRYYKNSQLKSSHEQLEHFTNWLMSESEFLMEEREAELATITMESLRVFQRQVLGQFHAEILVHGNLHKEDALCLTDMVGSILAPRALPLSQLPIVRSLMLPAGSDFVFERRLKDPQDVNHSIEYWLSVGAVDDRTVRAQVMLLAQMLHEPVFNQLRTQEQLGYIVFSGQRAFATTYGLRVLVQSEKTPRFLEGRINAFLDRYYTDTLVGMSEEEFESHKRSAAMRKLEKPKSLHQEWARHWYQIVRGLYEFDSAQQDAAHIRTLTKTDMVELWRRCLSPSSKQRAKLSVHLLAIGNAGLDAEEERREESKEEIVVMSEAGGKEEVSSSSSSSSQSAPVLITDVRAFKTSLMVSPGVRPMRRDLSEHTDTDAKL